MVDPKRKRILCIDDDKHVYAVVSFMLQQAGYHVECAVDGAQGVQFAASMKPDLIILDYMMPAGGGGTVFEHVRASFATSKTPILVFSAAHKAEIDKKITFDDRTRFLAKPTAPPLIVEMVNAMLGGAQA